MVLTLFNLIPVPFLGCLCCGLIWLAYVPIGALAGFYLEPPRTAGAGAGTGAIAGVISGVASGLFQTIVMAIQTAAGGAGQIAGMIDPEMMRQLTELGVDPETFAIFGGIGGVAIGGVLCCMFGLVMGAMLGALGGAIYCATQPE